MLEAQDRTRGFGRVLQGERKECPTLDARLALWADSLNKSQENWPSPQE